MKCKNICFSIGMILSISLVTGGLLAAIHHRVDRTAIPAQADPTQPVVALTFDDGPNARHTPQVLDILYDEQVPATFFVLGEKFDRNEPLVKEMAASGHEIGNHSFSHPDLSRLPIRQVQQEMQQTEDALREILPDYKIRYIRPPYGRYTEEMETALDLPLMLWTIDSLDWDNPDAEKIYATVMRDIHDKDIIVFHDDNAETPKALEKLIPALREKGFQFVTISQMAAMEPESIGE